MGQLVLQIGGFCSKIKCLKIEKDNKKSVSNQPIQFDRK